MEFRFLTFSALMMSAANATQAEGRLRATLMQANSYQPTKLFLTLTNEGDSPLAFEKYTTPLVLLDDVHTSYMQFDVKDVEPPHEMARYHGYFVHIIGHSESSYVTFQPGESRTATYDLAPDYELVPGKTYKVTFSMFLGQAPEDANGIPIPTNLRIPPREEVQSNTIVFTAGPDVEQPLGRTSSAGHYARTPL